MIRATIFLCFLVAFARSTPVPTEEEENLLAWKRIHEIYKSITEEENEIMREVSEDFKDDETLDDLFRAIQPKSSSLYEKLSKMRDILNEIIDLLADEDAKTFARKFFAYLPTIVKAFMIEISQKSKELIVSNLCNFENLSMEAKDSIGEHFPALKRLATSKITKFCENFE